MILSGQDDSITVFNAWENTASEPITCDGKEETNANNTVEISTRTMIANQLNWMTTPDLSKSLIILIGVLVSEGLSIYLRIS